MMVFFERPAPCLEVQGAIDRADVDDFLVVARARGLAIRRYGFAIPCVEAVSLLASLSPLLEVGAGSGHWARLAREAGADVAATDLGAKGEYGSAWKAREGVEGMSAMDAVARWPERDVFVSWPTYDAAWAGEMAARIAPGRTLAYLGEGRNGNAGDRGLFDVLERDFFEAGSVRVPRWPGMRDSLGVFVRR